MVICHLINSADHALILGLLERFKANSVQAE
jgi:hypothetical protein